MEEVLKLFSMLQLHEQMLVMNQIPNLIKVDFLALLPSLVAERILSYLSAKDVFNCYHVSKTWEHVVASTCTKHLMVALWKDVGLPASWVNKRMSEYPPYALLKLAVAAYDRLTQVTKSLQPLQSVPNPVGYDSFSWRISVKKNSYYSLCSTGNIVVYNEFRWTDESKFSYIENSHDRCINICQFKETFPVRWAGVYGDALIVATNNADWIMISDKTITSQWIDTEVISSSQTCIAVCSKCGITVQVHPDYSHQSSGRLKWTVQYIVLIGAQKFVNRTRCNFDLRVADSDLKENDAIFIQSIALVPPQSNDHSTDDPNPAAAGSSYCTTHRLLMQFNSSIVSFVASSSNRGELAEISFKHVFSPIEEFFPTKIKPILNLKNYKNIFKLSRSKTLLALLNCYTLFIWDVVSNTLVLRLRLIKWLTILNDIRLLCVGHIYCVVQYGSEICVFSILTESLVHRINLLDFANPATFMKLSNLSKFSDIYFHFFDQEWMNDL